MFHTVKLFGGVLFAMLIFCVCEGGVSSTFIRNIPKAATCLNTRMDGVIIAFHHTVASTMQKRSMYIERIVKHRLFQSQAVEIKAMLAASSYCAVGGKALVPRAQHCEGIPHCEDRNVHVD